ncbi:NAD(P)H-dependent oxidoreductase [Nitratireductor sp. ZSWI3]|uniref:NAD(P)H-dependent oxidoreductase n=1 Tax=Nitratireductor sp. ZSWI3 TaxID=2966359 RepID=UPI00214FBDC4|nr:NAD(P)H-dependent oxidoreductase [Nitratireductor sp. ZSWI3]MCR4266506.1 NAD(P)H-dependent oxidoreductase [Nitratireductor sp. ZSWI3]
MAQRVVIVLGHPDPGPERLCRAIAQAYREGAEKAGHEVESFDLAAIDFPLLRTQEDFLHGQTPEALKPVQGAISRAQHVVFVFPLWLGTMPALMKGFLEQVMRPGVAFAYGKTGFPETLLKGKSARIIVTMGMPALVYRFWFFGHGLGNLRRNILKFAGFSPVRTTLFGMIEGASEEKRRRWLDTVRALGAKAA